MTIPEILTQLATERPDQDAIIESPGGREWRVSFSQLDRLATAFAARLREEGIRTGDTVLVFVPMSVTLYAVLLGIFRAGAVAMFLDPSARRAHLAACCEIQPPRAFVGGFKARLLRWITPCLREIPIALAVTRDSLENFSAQRIVDDLPTPESPALITFTSGSTGKPKAAVRSHAFLIAQHAALVDSIALRSGEVDLTTLPVFVLANLASAVTSILPDADMRRPGAVDPAGIASQIDRYRPTRTGGSPAFYDRLADFEDGACLRNFQKIYTGGAPVFPGLLRRLQRRAPQAEVVAVYGSTEAEPIAHAAWRDFSADDLNTTQNGGGLLAGRTIPEIRCEVIVDQWGSPLPALTAEVFASLRVPAGQPGEIVVSGAHVLSGYLNGHGNAETKFQVDGVSWHRTGDAGYRDSQGRLWLLGRCSAKVTGRRGVLYPFAVECVAMGFEWVRRAAFLGTPSQRLLFLETHREAPAAGLESLRGALTPFQVDTVRVVPAIPLDRRHNAKVDYAGLRKLADS